MTQPVETDELIVALLQRELEWARDARKSVQDRIGMLMAGLGVSGTLLGIFLSSENAPRFGEPWVDVVRSGIVVLGVAFLCCLSGIAPKDDLVHRYLGPQTIASRQLRTMPLGQARSALITGLAFLVDWNYEIYHMRRRWLVYAIILVLIGTGLIALSLWYTVVG